MTSDVLRVGRRRPGNREPAEGAREGGRAAAARADRAESVAAPVRGGCGGSFEDPRQRHGARGQRGRIFVEDERRLYDRSLRAEGRTDSPLVVARRDVDKFVAPLVDAPAGDGAKNPTRAGRPDTAVRANIAVAPVIVAVSHLGRAGGGAEATGQRKTRVTKEHRMELSTNMYTYENKTLCLLGSQIFVPSEERGSFGTQSADVIWPLVRRLYGQRDTLHDGACAPANRNCLAVHRLHCCAGSYGARAGRSVEACGPNDRRVPAAIFCRERPKESQALSTFSEATQTSAWRTREPMALRPLVAPVMISSQQKSVCDVQLPGEATNEASSTPTTPCTSPSSLCARVSVPDVETSEERTGVQRQAVSRDTTALSSGSTMRLQAVRC